MEIEERIKNIEKEISEIKSEKKDIWDVVQILGAMLIPAAIAYAGWEYASAMKEAEINSASTIAKLQLHFSEQKERFDQRISETNTRVGQAGLVAAFLDPLLSEDPKKQKLAIEAVLIALPSEGLKLVKVIEETDKSDAVKAFASESLNSFRKNLIVGFFSDDISIRRDSYNRLFESYRDDKSIILELIKKGREYESNHDAVVNILVFLSHMNSELLKPYISEIVAYSEEVKNNGPKTRNRIRKLIGRFPCDGIEIPILDRHIAELQRWIPIEGNLKLMPKSMSQLEAHIAIEQVVNSETVEDMTIKKEQSSAFMYEGFRYTWTLNDISKQFGTGDLRINVNMTKQGCN